MHTFMLAGYSKVEAEGIIEPEICQSGPVLSPGEIEMMGGNIKPEDSWKGSIFRKMGEGKPFVTLQDLQIILERGQKYKGEACEIFK